VLHVNVMLPPVQVVVELAPSTTAGVTGGGTALITAAVDAPDVHVPSDTVNVYVVPAVSPAKVAVVPVPVCVAPPGDAVIVHVPAEGSPLSATDPVGVVQSG